MPPKTNTLASSSNNNSSKTLITNPIADDASDVNINDDDSLVINVEATKTLKVVLLNKYLRERDKLKLFLL
jgi:hypothetical protein